MRTEELLHLINEILKKGKDVEIRTCKDGYKVLEVTRKSEIVIERETLDSH